MSSNTLLYLRGRQWAVLVQMGPGSSGFVLWFTLWQWEVCIVAMHTLCACEFLWTLLILLLNPSSVIMSLIPYYALGNLNAIQQQHWGCEPKKKTNLLDHSGIRKFNIKALEGSHGTPTFVCVCFQLQYFHTTRKTNHSTDLTPPNDQFQIVCGGDAWTTLHVTNRR